MFLLVPMLRGFSAMKELARPRRRRVPPRRTVPRGGPGPAAVSAEAAATDASPRTTEQSAAAVSAPAHRTLSGEAERRRLQLGTVTAAPAGAAVRSRRTISMRSNSVSADEAAAALRFVARRCEIGPGGLRAFEANGKLRELAWSDFARIVVRALPPDPPWDGGLLLDLVAPLDGRWQPVRVFGPTMVNYAALPGGAGGSRLDNLRRLATHVRERNPAAAVDEETAGFLSGGAAPRFPDMTGFTEYDSIYG
jgi:hypothetical protein